jgi:hypothetical protein
MLEVLKIIGRSLKRWWMAFASALGWVNTRVLLTVVYFTLFALGAIILRLIGKDLLRRKLRESSSYWIDKGKADDTLERATHQF